MGGFIFLDSEYGKGSTFTVVIPQKVVNEEPLTKVDENAKYNILTYFELEEHNTLFAAKHYAEIIANIGAELGLAYQFASSAQEAKRYVEAETFTHLFISEAEYAKDREYFDSLLEQMPVVVITNQNGSAKLSEGIQSFPVLLRSDWPRKEAWLRSRDSTIWICSSSTSAVLPVSSRR